MKIHADKGTEPPHHALKFCTFCKERKPVEDRFLGPVWRNKKKNRFHLLLWRWVYKPWSNKRRKSTQI